MGHYSETRDDAFEGATSSVGCAAALLPCMWSRKHEKTVSNSKAESNSARDAHFVFKIDRTLSDPPFCLEIGSGTTDQNGEEVKMSILSVGEVRAEMCRRFRLAHSRRDARSHEGLLLD